MNVSAKNAAIIAAFKKGYHFDKNDNIVGPTGVNLRLHYSEGYPQFCIKPEKGSRKNKSIRVHRFKAYFLYGEKIFNKNIIVRHKDDNKNNWSSDNILIGTYRENSLDIPKLKRIELAKIASSYTKKFSDQEIQEIKKDKESGHTYSSLCEKYSTSKSTIFYIIKGVTYKPKALSPFSSTE